MTLHKTYLITSITSLEEGCTLEVLLWHALDRCTLVMPTLHHSFLHLPLGKLSIGQLQIEIETPHALVALSSFACLFLCCVPVPI